MRRPAGFALQTPAALMAAGTAVSRATGFVRTAALAALLGLSSVADAYNAAATLPTMLLVLVTGGTLSSALVPMLVRPKDPADRRAVASTVLLAVALVTGVVSVVLVVANSAVGDLLALSAPPGEKDRRAQLVADLVLVFSPQIFLLGVSVVANALLTAEGRLARVGATPVVANIVTLLGLATYALVTPEATQPPRWAVLLLGAGATAGVATSTVLQLRGCRDLLPPMRHIIGSARRWPLRELLLLSRWSAMYVASNQLGALFVLVVAGGATGVVSAYQWGFAVMQLPYAIGGVTILSALHPAMTRAAGDGAAFAGLVRRAVGLLLLVLGPAALALAVYADVIAAALLATAPQRDVTLLASGVRIFAAALLPFCLFQLLTRICYARQLPHLPALTNLAVNGTLVGGALLASAHDDPGRLLRGLGWGYCASYVVGCLVLLATRAAPRHAFVTLDRQVVVRAGIAGALVLAAGALRWAEPGLLGELAAAVLVVPAGVLAAVTIPAARRPGSGTVTP